MVWCAWLSERGRCGRGSGVVETGSASNQLTGGFLGVWGPRMEVDSKNRGSLAVGLVVEVLYIQSPYAAYHQITFWGTSAY